MKQHIFDTVLNHLRARGVVLPGHEQRGYTVCHFRDENGLPCALGLPEPDVKPIVELKPVAKLRDLFPCQDKFTNSCSNLTWLLSSLQDAHDGLMPRRKGDTTANWESGMRTIARMYRLAYTPVTVPQPELEEVAA